MNGNEDIRSMLAKRAKVPPRDNNLKLGSSKLSEANWSTEEEVFSGTSKDAQIKEEVSSSNVMVDSVILSAQDYQARQVFPPDNSSSLSTNDINHIEAELKKLPKTGKRLAIHLEEEVRHQLMAFCDRHELTPEVFLEAIFVNFYHQYEKADSKKLAKVVDDAKERLAKRKKVGLLKRTLSIIKKIKT